MRQTILACLIVTVPASRAVLADELPDRLVVATWNVEWFFDHHTGDNRSELAKKLSAPSADEWQWRLNGVAAAIARMRPSVLALQEVENQQVLYALCQKLRREHGLLYRDAFIQGRDFYTEQDVALLWQSGLREYARKVPSRAEFQDPQVHSIPKHLVARFQWGEGDRAERLTLVNLHLRAMPENAEVRVQQARLLRRWFGDQIRRGDHVIVLGDINTEEKFADTAPDSEVGILRGLASSDTSHRLVDLHQFVPPSKRYTHLIFRQFDRILVTHSLMRDAPGRRDLVFKSVRVRHDLVVQGERQDEDHWNIYYEIPQRERDLSDHYPIVAEFEVK
jgi:endonuclease/exonuclease/phosphatase family metal-dependent hydrolase